MPEGHTIHRQARLQTERFVGEPLAVSSPQGRFSLGAEALDGHSIEDIEPRGKHLFYTWDHGQLLHVHLGLFGRFRTYRDDPPPPTEGTRLALRSNTATTYLSGPTICALLDEAQRDRIIARLGPDPLSTVTDDEAVRHIEDYLSRRSSPVSAALLDQQVIAGIGNVYRSELLFLTGIDPRTPSNKVSSEQIAELWAETVRQLRVGERSGRIVTTRPEHVGVRRRSDIRRGDRAYVYKRQGEACRMCGTTIRMTEAAGRKVWWCPECQGKS